jgi:hypothetical protein
MGVERNSLSLVFDPTGDTIIEIVQVPMNEE